MLGGMQSNWAVLVAVAVGVGLACLLTWLILTWAA